MILNVPLAAGAARLDDGVATIVFDIEENLVELDVAPTGTADEDGVTVAEGALLLELPAVEEAVEASAEIDLLVEAVLPVGVFVGFAPTFELDDGGLLARAITARG